MLFFSIFLFISHIFFSKLLKYIIAKYKYSTVELFLDDLQLMAKNCELFNGSEHALTKEAYLIHTEAIHLINVEREVLGKDKDPYTVQQNDIRIK